MSQVWTQHFFSLQFFFFFFQWYHKYGRIWKQTRQARSDWKQFQVHCFLFYGQRTFHEIQSSQWIEYLPCFFFFFFFNGAWEYLYSIGNGEKKTNTPSLFAKASGLGNNYSHIFFVALSMYEMSRWLS